MAGARVVQLSISPGGVPKRAVPSAELTPLGLVGDGHRDTEHHGGPDRAVCLYSLEQLARLVAEGHPVAPGVLGENVTTEGVELGALEPGDRLKLGAAAAIEIASRVDPCRTIAHAFSGGRFSRIGPSTHPAEARLYARVIAPGVVRVGDSITRLAR